MAWEMLDLNNMLPLQYTESSVDRKIVWLYLKRNSFFTGVLFSPEFSGKDQVSTEEYPQDPEVFE